MRARAESLTAGAARGCATARRTTSRCRQPLGDVSRTSTAREGRRRARGCRGQRGKRCDGRLPRGKRLRQTNLRETVGSVRAARVRSAMYTPWTHDTIPCTPRHPPWLRLPTIKPPPPPGPPGDEFAMAPAAVGMLPPGSSALSSRMQPRWALDDNARPTVSGSTPRSEFHIEWEQRAAASARSATAAHCAALCAL